MLLPTTEQRSANDAIDALPLGQAFDVLMQGQADAIAAVAQVAGAIEGAAEHMARAIRTGGSLVYAAAGSSGLMALADACELPGTFGVAQSAIKIHMAGGVPADGCMPGATEDDTASARVAAQDVKIDDAVIVLSASGTTPYAVAMANAARDRGGKVIAIANNPGSTLLEVADVPICLETPAEVIGGSTRLGAGTAQKAALNAMSSLMGIKLGHVYQGFMVNVVADNAKLVKRASGIVCQITGATLEEAQAALKQTNGQTKLAILVAAGCPVHSAEAVLAKHDGQLEHAIQSLRTMKH